jgi:hypothetical protein
MNSQRIESLENQHARLKFELAKLTARPMSDMSQIQALKRQKLRIKDELLAAQSRVQAAHHYKAYRQQPAMMELS